MIRRSLLFTLTISFLLLLFGVSSEAQTEYDYITNGNNALTEKVHFDWVKANGNKTFVEYDLAIAELNRKPGATTKKPLPKKRP